MQHTTPIRSSQPQIRDEVIVISRDVFRALHPLDQLAARALEKVGKVRIDQDNLTGR
jgi:hypothetical protein